MYLRGKSSFALKIECYYNKYLDEIVKLRGFQSNWRRK
jgi:hypothetical protein